MAGEEGIWTDIEGSAEAMSAYEVDVNKLWDGRGYKGRDSRDFSHCEAGVRFPSGSTGVRF
jgi:hypothetical protein